ncbi:MAG: response regulator [Arcobacteraceae bacterium]|nr:response regulator [Arcobacteraceae bacterium]
MIDQDLLKKINILYVEDDEVIQNSTLNVFEKLFKDVFVASNGQEGLDLYKQLIADGIVIDVVITDINMPKMNGLEMLSYIRKLDYHLSFVITSAHVEAHHFLEAIKLNVIHYAVKPLQIKELMLQIQDICHQKYQDMIIKNTHKENERYLDIINKVAIVSRTDINGNIIFANDIFCEVSGYSREELIGANQRIVKHPEVARSVFDDLWDTLRSKNIWRGKIKNQAKDGSSYVVNAHIFPVFDESGENVIEYMAVRFLITEEENKKRQFHQKVISSIQEQRKKEQDLQNTIKELEQQLKSTDYSNISLMRDSLSLEKQRMVKAKSQISHYENELKYEKDKNQKMFQESQKKLVTLADENKKNKSLSSEYRNTITTLQLEIMSKGKEIERINEMLTKQTKIIADLKDVIAHREEQLKTKK